MTKNLALSTGPVRNVAKRTTPEREREREKERERERERERCCFGAKVANEASLEKRPAGQGQVQQTDTQDNRNESVQAAAQPSN